MHTNCPDGAAGHKSLPALNFHRRDIGGFPVSNPFFHLASLITPPKQRLLLLPPQSMAKPRPRARPGPSKQVCRGKPMMDGPWQEVIYNLSPPCARVRQLRQTERDKKRQKQRDACRRDRRRRRRSQSFSWLW